MSSNGRNPGRRSPALSRSRLVAAATVLAVAACGDGDDPPDQLTVSALYDHAIGKVVVELSRPLEAGERLQVGTRRGRFGELDCADTVATRVAVTGEGTLLSGPPVDAALTQPFYGPAWNGEPTEAMLASLAGGTDSIIDVCVTAGSRVLVAGETDLFQAWDRGRRISAAPRVDHALTGEARIESALVYGQRCVAELGEIPFFEPTAPGRYTTASCLDGTPIPMTITTPTGGVQHPTAIVPRCDKPQYAASGEEAACEPGPRVASRTNAQGTRWTLLCRKAIGGMTSAKFADIAMIGHNPLSGKTCFFQNAVHEKIDGSSVPHPADTVRSTDLWSGVHGGIGSGMQCVTCHDADAFIHTPWIDGARDASNRPVVPKMGVDPDFPLGANDRPYSLVNAAGQGWSMPRQLTSPEAAACTGCHRLGDGRWVEWVHRLDGTDLAFRRTTSQTYRTFARIHWMPPNLGGLDETTFPASPFGRAIAFIKGCATSRDSCQWADIPGSTVGGGLSDRLRYPVDLPDTELADQAVALLGIHTPGAASRCGSCHGRNQGTLRDWRQLTTLAESACLSDIPAPAARVVSVPAHDVAEGAFEVHGPSPVAIGGTFRVDMSGSGNADLYVRRGLAPTLTEYDCRPRGDTSTEGCSPVNFDASGPGQFWVGVHGHTAGTVALRVEFPHDDDAARSPADVVACLRLDQDRADSPFVPYRAGIYSAAAHLGWFERIFRAAYPGTPENPDPWIAEYTRFQQRVAMPKGNHPRFTQGELDIVAEWFARGLPQLDRVVPPDPAPTTCTPTVTPTLTSHVDRMRLEGWSAVNRERGLAMHGCTTADPRQCLTTYPTARSQPFGVGWEYLPGGTLRILSTLGFRSRYWMRSSADGRFIGNGSTSGAGAVTTDLLLKKDIPTHAAYDPGYFPDNSGFVFQGTPIGTGFCTTNLMTSAPAEITFGEEQCSSDAQVGLYQHLGSGLGSDHFAIAGQFTSDDGGHRATLSDPSTDFGRTTEVTLTPMTFDGRRYVALPGVDVRTPFEGDSILSPSTELMVSRLAGPGDRQLGFVIRKVIATRTDDGYAITAPEIGRICRKGGKPAVSFDERWMAYYHYVEANDWAELGFPSATDPRFLEYRSRGAANIFMVDLLTGATTRVTHMSPGQHALFPHFRSDGWLYFLVRDAVRRTEYTVASDAAMVLTGR
jgi:hypothetical protein